LELLVCGKHQFNQRNFKKLKLMRQVVLFLSRFLFSLWIVLISAFLFLLVSNAPNVPTHTPFANVSINAEHSSTVYLPNRIFTCKEIGQQFQCQTTIKGAFLNLDLTKGRDYKYNLTNCRALYDGQSVGCREISQTYAPILSKMYEITGLKLNPQQLEAVQQEYWGINVFQRLGEPRLLWIVTGISLAVGVSAAFFTWLHPGLFSKLFVSFACGFGMYHLVWGLLGRVSYDALTPYGFTLDTWGWVMYGGATIAGIGTIIATAFLLWQRFNHLTKILFGISSSLGIFNICWLSFSWNLTHLPSIFGIFETFLQNGYALMWISAAISTIFAIFTIILLWSQTNQSIKKFLCLGSGFGAVALFTNLSLFILLGMGYVD
jgi:hypothetical protein